MLNFILLSLIKISIIIGLCKVIVSFIPNPLRKNILSMLQYAFNWLKTILFTNNALDDSSNNDEVITLKEKIKEKDIKQKYNRN